MMKKGLRPVMVMILAMAATSPARAQLSVMPVHIGIAGGGTIPLGDFGNTFNTGFNATGTVAITPPLLPLGFRIDGAYNQFGSKGTSSLKAKIAGLTANVTYGLGGFLVTPYLIGGGGYYRVSSSLAGGTAASNHGGFNIGGGVNLPLMVFKGFAEARYNHVSTSGGSTSFVPVTVGLMF